MPLQSNMRPASPWAGTIEDLERSTVHLYGPSETRNGQLDSEFFLDTAHLSRYVRQTRSRNPSVISQETPNMPRKRNSDLLPECQPAASLDRFWQSSVVSHPGGRVSTFLTYLTYTAWYINEHEAGPSADWEDFKKWYFSRKLDWEGETDDTKWFKDIQIVRTLPFMLSEEETDSLLAELSRTIKPEAWARHARRSE